MTKHQGAATLLITFVLFLSAVLIIIFAANYSSLQQKTSTNTYSNNQAFEAAEAGLEFGIQYLTTNINTITATASSGVINYGPTDTNITNVSLANSSNFSVVYTNPTANDYTVIQVTSTGTSVDGTATRIAQQQVNQTSSLSTLTTQGNVNVSGLGGTVTGPYAVTAGGTVDSSAPQNGLINQNVAAIASMSGAAFFQSIFGVTEAVMQAQSTVYTPASVPWATVTGDVWVNGDVSLAGGTTGGSLAHPILLVVNGNLDLKGNAQIFGVVYVTGSANVDVGNGTVIGALISQGSVALKGNGGVTYNASIINKLLAGTSPFSLYAKVPGSWRDF